MLCILADNAIDNLASLKKGTVFSMLPIAETQLNALKTQYPFSLAVLWGSAACNSLSKILL